MTIKLVSYWPFKVSRTPCGKWGEKRGQTRDNWNNKSNSFMGDHSIHLY
jgi:hypothetical protein